MKRADLRKQRHRHVWSIGALPIAVILMIITITITHRTHLQQATPAVSSAVAQHTSKKTHGQPSTSQNTQTASSAKATASATLADGTETVGNPAKYDYLNGTYDFGATPTVNINFDNQTTTGVVTGGTVVTYHFTKVLRHTDGTLVVNVAGSFRPHQSPNSDDAPIKTRYVEISLLIAPSGIVVTKNWQTGAAITDATDASTVRMAITGSDDGGQTFNMTRAYDDFASNQNVGVLQ